MRKVLKDMQEKTPDATRGPGQGEKPLGKAMKTRQHSGINKEICKEILKIMINIKVPLTHTHTHTLEKNVSERRFFAQGQTAREKELEATQTLVIQLKEIFWLQQSSRNIYTLPT